ncbi:hypothetical protein, partial [Aquisalimonas sp.]|uniref:hypothetical protein n=1 Tax=Aquisalimonas sp. TaxID=1872621 RepID=UPI0025B8C101
MEVYSRELAHALDQRSELTVRSLPGRPDGSAPARWRIPGFLLRVIAHLLRHGRRQDVIVLGDLVLLPIAVMAR